MIFVYAGRHDFTHMQNLRKKELVSQKQRIGWWVPEIGEERGGGWGEADQQVQSHSQIGGISFGFLLHQM